MARSHYRTTARSHCLATWCHPADATALIVIDLQQGVVGVPSVDPREIERSAAPGRRFREHGLPVVLVTSPAAAAARRRRRFGSAGRASPPLFVSRRRSVPTAARSTGRLSALAPDFASSCTA
jgi:nicotinamidase-related amidase